MALTPQPLRRADDPASNTTVLGPVTPENWRVWSNKIGDLTRASAAAEAHPRYDSMTDWHGGDIGEDIGENDAAQAIAGRNGGIDNDYEPRHQEEKAENMAPPLSLLLDIGKDYGPFSGSAYHNGTIKPNSRYPSVSTEETPEQFRSATYELPPEPEVIP